MTAEQSRHQQGKRQRGTGVRRLLSGGAILVFACAAWSVEPDGVFPVAMGQTSNSTAPMSDQPSGESGAAKSGAVLPQRSPTGGGGQSSSGEAAQIEQSAGPLKLSDAQRQKIQSYFANKKSQRQQTAGFTLSIGAAVPRKAKLQKLPPEITSALGGYQGDDYMLIGNQLVIVSNDARRVVAIVPDIG